MRKDNILYIVVPCYNEEEVLPESSKELKSILEKLIEEDKISSKSKILFVNDGSKDKTWQLIEELHNESKYFTGICLSRNRGHQNAVLAGMSVASDYADMIITIDADLQDDPVCISQMVEKYHEGFEVVSGVRNDRKSDTFFKRVTAQAYYKIMKWMGVDLIYNSADCRLLSKRATKALMDYKEVNLFLRGIIPLIGFKYSCVYYDRNERISGKSHYPLKKMLLLAFDGITSLSIQPIRIIMSLGIIISIFSVFGIIWAIVKHSSNDTAWGWSSLISFISFFGGLQLFSTGIIGEYIGKIYLETKQRPRYIVDKTTFNKDEKH